MSAVVCLPRDLVLAVQMLYLADQNVSNGAIIALLHETR